MSGENRQRGESLIIHILNNGKQIQDIADVVVPLNNKTTKAYEILSDSAKGEKHEDN